MAQEHLPASPSYIPAHLIPSPPPRPVHEQPGVAVKAYHKMARRAAMIGPASAPPTMMQNRMTSIMPTSYFLPNGKRAEPPEGSPALVA